MKPKPVLSFLIVMCAAALLRAEETNSVKVALWPDHPPGAKADANYKEEVGYRDDAKTQSRFSRVTEPTLQIFLPAPEKATGAAVVICPGGGYGMLAYDHEGLQVAQFFSELGIAAFILKYRLPHDAIMEDKSVGPLQDVQEALRTVRRRAADWHVNPSKIGIMGFSAGGHLAASATVLHDWNVYPVADGVSARPDFSILVYPVISMQAHLSHGGSRKNLLGENPNPERQEKLSIERQVNANTPPTFLIHSADDNVVRVENSIEYMLAAKRNNVPVELHVYSNGGHGYGLHGHKGWTDALKIWLRNNGCLPAQP